MRQAAASIRQGGGTVLGIALNQVPSSAFDRLRYGETVYGYAAADRIPSSHPATSSRTSSENATTPSAVPSQSHPGVRHADAEQVGGTADAASMEEFVAMLRERRSTASRWASADAQTWRARTDNRRTTSTALKTRAR